MALSRETLLCLSFILLLRLCGETVSESRWPLDLNVLPPFFGLLRYTWLRVWLTILKSKNRSQFWIQLAALHVLSARLNRPMSSSHAEQTRHDGHAEVLNEDTVPGWIWERETGPAEVLALVWGHVVLYHARRLLQFVPTGPGLPGQYRIDPTARLSSSNLATLHNTPPGFPLPQTLSNRSPSPAPRTPPEDAERFHHYWTGPPPRANQTPRLSNDNRARERSRSRDAHAD